MREWVADSSCEGMRVDRFLGRILPSAESGFLQKMLRKKNITRNGARASGSDRLSEGDRICVYFSDETLARFMAPKGSMDASALVASANGAHDGNAPRTGDSAPVTFEVLYEDDDFLALNKPAGLLTQKASAEDVSLNDLLIRWLVQERGYTGGMLSFFTPSAANRLDRNTSGIVLAGKTLRGQQQLSAWLSGRGKGESIRKIYRAIVSGDAFRLTDPGFLVESGIPVSGERNAFCGVRVLSDPAQIRQLPENLLTVEQQNNLRAALGERSPWVLASHYLKKDTAANRVQILSAAEEGAVPVHTAIHPRAFRDGRTDLELLLLTGRSHQLRAHLAWLGFPVSNDPKYGVSAGSRPQSHSGRQLLHAWRAVLPGIGCIEAPLPADFPHWTKE